MQSHRMSGPSRGGSAFLSPPPKINPWLSAHVLPSIFRTTLQKLKNFLQTKNHLEWEFESSFGFASLDRYEVHSKREIATRRSSARRRYNSCIVRSASSWSEVSSGSEAISRSMASMSIATASSFSLSRVVAPCGMAEQSTTIWPGGGCPTHKASPQPWVPNSCSLTACRGPNERPLARWGR
jgi:hypothetical protein